MKLLTKKKTQEDLTQAILSETVKQRDCYSIWAL